MKQKVGESELFSGWKLHKGLCADQFQPSSPPPPFPTNTQGIKFRGVPGEMAKKPSRVGGFELYLAAYTWLINRGRVQGGKNEDFVSDRFPTKAPSNFVVFSKLCMKTRV